MNLQWKIILIIKVLGSAMDSYNYSSALDSYNYSHLLFLVTFLFVFKSISHLHALSFYFSQKAVTDFFPDIFSMVKKVLFLEKSLCPDFNY